MLWLKLPGKIFLCHLFISLLLLKKKVEIKGCYCHFVHFLSCWVVVGTVKAALGAEFFWCVFFFKSVSGIAAFLSFAFTPASVSG